jgi:hypothetical protein
MLVVSLLHLQCEAAAAAAAAAQDAGECHASCSQAHALSLQTGFGGAVVQILANLIC